jgi:hypothetical protein
MPSQKDILVYVRREILDTIVNSHPRFVDYSDAIDELKAILRNYPKVDADGKGVSE